MIQQTIPRVVLAGTHSGCGKTTVMCALLQAFADRGLRVASFKCGPDYIDPMFHSRIIGAKSSNLDSFFFSADTNRYLLGKNAQGCDLSIVEGVMGFYDGLGLTGTRASTYEMAQITHSPVIMVVNARGASLSVLAMIQGFKTFYPDSGIAGVILNNCSAMVYPALAQAITQHFGKALRPLGFLPPLPECAVESRHLGLVTAAEVKDLQAKMQRLAQQAEKTIDLDAVLALSQQAPPLTYEPVQLPHFEQPIRIAVAQDRAFCFYYQDSLDVLRMMGAELVPFSPLTDAALPEDIQGLYLGGGYPELYAAQLSDNHSMRQSVGRALAHKLPCIAECGGFMYLNQAIGPYPMVGHLPGVCFDTKKLTRFGYITLKAQTSCLLCEAGEEIPAHEFHHWDCSQNGTAFSAQKPSGKSWACSAADAFLYAGYPHFHFMANLNFAKNFYLACLKEKEHDRDHQTYGD